MNSSLDTLEGLSHAKSAADGATLARFDSAWQARFVMIAFLPLSGLLLIPPPWLAASFLIVPIYLGVRWLLRTSPLPQTRANIFILLLLVATLGGLLVTPAPIAGAVSVGKLLAGILAFFALEDFLRTPSERWLVTAGVVTLGLALVLLIPFAVEWSLNKVYPIPFLDGMKPPTSGINPNVVAAVLALCFPLAFALLARKPWRIFGAVAIVSLLAGLVVLQSRGAWFALGGGFLLAATAYRRWLLPVFALALLAALGLNSLVGGPSLAPYVLGRVGTATSGTTLERQALWAQAVQLIEEHPVAGIGLGAYPSVAPYLPPYSRAKPGLLAAHAHNLYFQVALDAGLPGLIGFAALLGAAIVAAWQANARRNMSALALGVLGALGVVAVNGLVDSIFWGLKAEWLVFILVALAFSFESKRTGGAMKSVTQSVTTR